MFPSHDPDSPDQSQSGGFEIDLGGYTQGGNVWENAFSIIKGKLPTNKVRLAYDGTSRCILLGTTTTIWTIPTLAVTDLLVGYNILDGWETGWSASIITSETGLTNIVEPTLQGTTPTETVITTGFASGWSGSLRLWKNKENKASLLLSLVNNVDIVAGTTVLYTLAVGDRPKYEVCLTVNLWTNGGVSVANSFANIVISTNGEVQLRTVTSTTLTTARQIRAFTVDFYLA